MSAPNQESSGRQFSQLLGAMRELRMPFTVGVIVVASASLVWAYRARQSALTRAKRPMPLQCAHYATQRVCQLLGVPISEKQVAALIQPNPDGHSFADMEAAVKRIGLEVEGYSEDWESLMSGPFPCIVQLREPDHFVVLARTSRDRVILFDDLGRRRVAQPAAIQKRWSGAVLRVSKPAGWPPNKAAPAQQVTPWAVFDTLIADAGEIAHGAKEVEFQFPIVNRGKAPLEITKVDVSCKCLSVEKPTTIAPGKKGVITLKYSPETTGPAGLVAQEAVVSTNDPQFPRVRLTALASLESRVQLFPPQVTFSKLPADELARGYTMVLYRGDQPEDFKLVPMEDFPAGVSCRIVSYDDFVRAVGATGIFAKPVDLERKRFVEITVDGAAVEKSHGRFHGTVKFQSGISHVGEIGVPYSGTVVAPIEARPRILAFRHERVGDDDNAVAVVRLHSKRPYNVNSVSEGRFSARVVERPSGRPGHEIELQISMPPERARELHRSPVVISVENAESGREALLDLTAYFLADSVAGQ